MRREKEKLVGNQFGGRSCGLSGGFGLREGERASHLLPMPMMPSPLLYVTERQHICKSRTICPKLCVTFKLIPMRPTRERRATGRARGSLREKTTHRPIDRLPETNRTEPNQTRAKWDPIGWLAARLAYLHALPCNETRRSSLSTTRSCHKI